MPALNAPSPALAVVRPTRRRVWSHPELQSHSLLVLTRDHLYLAPLAGSPRPDVVAAAESDGDLDDLLGPLATIVDLAFVRRVNLDLLANSMTVDCERNDRAKSRIALTFATPNAADACFSKIWRRLGEGCRLQPNQRDAWSLARAPLACLGAILAVTAFLALSITTIDDLSTARAAASVNLPGDGGPTLLPPSLQSFLGWMDWRVICVLGGAAAAATQVWLYRRITQPPVSLEVIRT